MVTQARRPLKIDYEKTSKWALSSLGSAGLGPAGVQLFDLVNRVTHRSHRLELKTLGIGLAPPFTGSFGSSEYVNFNTFRAVNFFDFDGTNMTVRETNAGLYSWTTVSFWGMSVKISGGGLSIPGLSVSNGNAKILFSDGKPVGDPDLEMQLPRSSPEPEPFKQHAKEDATLYKIPGDILFAFNKYHLQPGTRTENALTSIGWTIHSTTTAEYRILVLGHTDSIGSRAYNITLSKRRAQTVASWLTAKNLAKPAWIKAIGVGESEPIASNATEEGRAENRRVEVVGIRTKLWESYR